MFRLIHDLLIINNVDQISNFAIHMQMGKKKKFNIINFLSDIGAG